MWPRVTNDQHNITNIFYSNPLLYIYILARDLQLIKLKEVIFFVIILKKSNITALILNNDTTRIGLLYSKGNSGFLFNSTAL